MDILADILDLLQIVAIAYFGGTSLYLLFFAVAGLFMPSDHIYPNPKIHYISIIIPGFKEDFVILETLQKSLEQNYPKDSFRVILVADHFLPETLKAVEKFPVTSVEVSFDISTKVKSLQKAIDYLPEQTDVVLVLDADNHIEADFLMKVNAAFESGTEVVQCHRIAKNTNTSFALLDAISEEINNHIFRKGHAAIGFSPALIGSAMAFNIRVFRHYIPRLEAIGGFDKELELLLLNDRKKITYLNQAYVLDEKVQNAKVFYKQRKRWISSQLYYFGQDFLKAIKQLFTEFNIQYLNKALQFSLAPRIVTLGVLIIINLAYLFFPFSPFKIAWLISLSACLFAVFFSIPIKFYTLTTLKAVLRLPRVFFIMLILPLIVRGTNKKFLHTEHEYQMNSENFKKNEYENRH